MAQVKGTIFLHPKIWTEIEQVAAADGVPPSEELRACVLDGLRVRQQRLKNAGVGISDTGDNKKE